ncbi:hypothetical protein MBCUR_07790 [Methanobrevibacter curvatus]|uniref:Uncharacterized protein n=1 Tax=Methanobrevibacter curvatus TaxID=49547 RepID=A0A166BAN6_9EURY|nr:hypothetical protein MBCUR_07790 [Methanobrevibacter curvatus]
MLKNMLFMGEDVPAEILTKINEQKMIRQEINQLEKEI